MDHRSLLAVLCLGFTVTGMSYGQVISSFDVDTEGWIVWDANCSNYSQTLATHIPTWQPAGGDGGGWVQHHDSTNYCSFCRAGTVPGRPVCLRERLPRVLALLDGIGLAELRRGRLDRRREGDLLRTAAHTAATACLAALCRPATSRRIHLQQRERRNRLGGRLRGSVGGPRRPAVPAEFGAQIEETVGLDSVWLRQPGTPSTRGRPSWCLCSRRVQIPSTHGTTVSFTLPAAGHTTPWRFMTPLRDGGRRLVDETPAAGPHTVDWDGRMPSAGVDALGDVLLQADDRVGRGDEEILVGQITSNGG